MVILLKLGISSLSLLINEAAGIIRLLFPLVLQMISVYNVHCT